MLLQQVAVIALGRHSVKAAAAMIAATLLNHKQWKNASSCEDAKHKVPKRTVGTDGGFVGTSTYEAPRFET